MTIEEKFEDIIRNRMTDRQFWQWVGSWKDVESIIEEVLDWDEVDKLELINGWKE